jgi:TonB family protein
MVSIWEDSGNKAQKVKMHRTQRLDKEEAIKETSVHRSKVDESSRLVENTKRDDSATEYTPQTVLSMDGTLTVKTLEDCVAGDIPSTGVALPVQINKDNVLQDYIYKIRTEIEKKKNYPQIARRKGIEGVVRVQFCISNDGGLKGVTIDASSGCPILDNEAVLSVKKASPFSCIPEELKKEGLDLKVNIAFKLEG